MATNTIYPFDPTGKKAENLVPSEQHIITENNFKNYYFIVPRFAPFFIESLIVTRIVNGSVVTLTEGVDYYGALPFVGASRAIGVPVFGAISFASLDIAGIVNITYQTVGGDWVFDDATVLETMANQSYNPFTTTWEQVTGAPTVFPVIDHAWNLIDMVGEAEVVEKLVDIEQAILSKASVPVNTTTKQALGLGLVENYPPATAQQAVAGVSSSTVITPATLKAALAGVQGGNNDAAIAALQQADIDIRANINAIDAENDNHRSNQQNPHLTTAAQVGLGQVENLSVISDQEAAAGSNVRKYVTMDQLLKMSLGGGGSDQFKITIDLSGSSSAKFYPVWWNAPTLVASGGVAASYSLMRKTTDVEGSVNGTLTMLAEAIGSFWDAPVVNFTKIKFFNQPLANNKFIRCLKHGMKAVYRNKNKAGLGLPSFSGQTSGVVSLAGTRAGCFLRGGSIYQLTTNSLIIKNSLGFANNDVEREISYDTTSANEGGWYTRSYAEGDSFLEGDYPNMARDDAFFSWTSQPSVYTFTPPVSATFTWASPNLTMLSGANPNVQASLALLPASANLIAVTKFTKQSNGAITEVTTPFTSAANGTFALTISPTLTTATGDVFTVSSVVSRADTGDVLVTSSNATITVSTPALTSSGTGTVYLGQSITIALGMTSLAPNTPLTLRLSLVNPSGVKVPWTDAGGVQYTKAVTTDANGAASTTTVFIGDGSYTAGIWKVAFDTTVDGVTYTSTNNSAITVPATSVTVPGTASTPVGGNFSINYAVTGFGPNTTSSGTPYLMDPSGARVTFASATGVAGTVSIVADANGAATGNITGTMQTTVAAGTWRVGLDIVTNVNGSSKTYSSSTLGTLTVQAVNGASTASLVGDKTSTTAGTNVTYTANYAGLSVGAGLYRIEFGTTLNNASVVTESIAVSAASNGTFTYSRVYSIAANTLATSVAAYSKLIRISDNAVLTNSSATTVAILAPAPTGRTWAPNIGSVIPSNNVTFNGTVTGVYGSGRYRYDLIESMADGSQSVTTSGAITPDGSGNWSVARTTTISNGTSAAYFQSKLVVYRVSDSAVLTDTGYQQVPVTYPVPTLTYARTGGNNPAAPGDAEYYRATISNVFGAGKYRVCTLWNTPDSTNVNVTYETINGNTIMDRGYVVPTSSANGTLTGYAFLQRISDGANMNDGAPISISVVRNVVVRVTSYIDGNRLLWIGGSNASGLIPGRRYDVHGYGGMSPSSFAQAPYIGPDSGNGSAYNIANGAGVINIPAEYVGYVPSGATIYLYLAFVDTVTGQTVGYNTTQAIVPGYVEPNGN